VKGGVGKSTLSWLAATALAREHPTLLVDMDLTGTSLADVFPLRAPRLPEVGNRLVLQNSSGHDFFSVEESRIAMDRRAQAADPIARFVPFLNDDLLCELDRFDPDRDADPCTLAWRVETPDEKIRENLRVIPSSALPNDLFRILPVIYDEAYAGFLEGRLEWFLARVLANSQFTHIVFDSPPTIPGLSMALLSMAMRLPRRIGLTPNGWGETPSPLRDAKITWAPVLVTTPDLQDLRAADRWLGDLNDTEAAAITVAVNRATNDDSATTAHVLRAHLTEATNIAFGLDIRKGALAPEVYPYAGVIVREDRVAEHLVAVAESDAFRMFQRQRFEFPAVTDGIRKILANLESPRDAA